MHILNIPLSADELIDELARLYPEVIYDPKSDRDEFLLQSGERRLVLNLLNARRIEREESQGRR